PSIGFPFQHQLPPIARVNQYYTFTLNNQTFIPSSSSSPILNYYIDHLPNWLSFNQNNFTLSGTPSSNHVSDNIFFSLTASDSTGNISQSCSIIVSQNSSPQLNSSLSISSQLSNYGQTNGLDGLIIIPGQSFSLSIDPNIFSSNSSLTYYGRYSMRTSLPSFINFDSANLTFYGTAPSVNSQIAPSLEYPLVLIASDYEGFSALETQFKLIIGAHQLSTSINSIINIPISTNYSFTYPIPLSDIYLDNQQISHQNISAITLPPETPTWIQIDTDYNIHGTVPNNQTENLDFILSIYNIYDDYINLPFQLNVSSLYDHNDIDNDNDNDNQDALSRLFTVDSLNNVTAVPGSFFTHALNESLFTSLSQTLVTAEFASHAAWLSFHSSNLTFNGNVPDSFESLQVLLIASLNTNYFYHKRDLFTNQLSFTIISNGLDVAPISSGTNSDTKTSSSNSS
ncbi:Axl2p ASCRUDRAFT_16944, partial [Ascoidea rubescens DSM 1968]